MTDQHDLHSLIRFYLEIEQKDEYIKAKRLIDAQNKLKEEIKSHMKKMNINKTILQIGGKATELGFHIRYLKQVDVHAIPEDIKKRYTIPKEYWYIYYK